MSYKQSIKKLKEERLALRQEIKGFYPLYYKIAIVLSGSPEAQALPDYLLFTPSLLKLKQMGLAPALALWNNSIFIKDFYQKINKKYNLPSKREARDFTNYSNENVACFHLWFSLNEVNLVSFLAFMKTQLCKNGTMPFMTVYSAADSVSHECLKKKILHSLGEEFIRGLWLEEIIYGK